MAVYSEIQVALLDFVKESLPSGFKVVGENERYKPVIDQPFAQCTLIPAITVASTLGSTGKNQYSGLFQVSFFVPAQSGTTGNDLVDQLVEAVQGSPLLDIGSTSLQLRAVSRLASRVETDWFHLPCRIEFWAYV